MRQSSSNRDKKDVCEETTENTRVAASFTGSRRPQEEETSISFSLSLSFFKGVSFSV